MDNQEPDQTDSREYNARPFTLLRSGNSEVPVLIAVPHGGREYTDDVRNRMRRPEYAMLRLEDRMVDRLAEMVAERTGAGLLIAKAPRAMIDLNRSVDDVDWSMIAEGASEKVRHSQANRRARSGLGLIPRRLPGLGEIWNSRIDRAELDRRIEEVHRPYHRALGEELEAIRDRWGAALLLDFHSMPPLPRRHAGEPSAEFVIGDRFGASCDAMLSARILSYFGSRDRPVAHNRPYAGGYVLERHAAPARGIHAIQVEICRSTYLDGQFDNVSPRLPAMVRLISGMVRTLAYDVAQLGSGSSSTIAAE